jgi:hypothetical protein
MTQLAGAMQYDKQYLKIESPPVPSLEVVFRCAAPLFHCEALDRVESFLGTEKRVVKTAAIDVPAELAAARERMALAGRMWNEIESGNYAAEAARRSVAADEAAIRNFWVEIGLLAEVHAGGLPAWTFRTQLNEDLQARCFGCGRRVQGKKFKFLEAGRCPRCQATTHFAILPPKQQG